MKLPPPGLIPSKSPSLLERLLEVLQSNGSLRICFDDLSGITVDYPELHLDVARQIHDCAHCRLGKATGQGTVSRFTDCALNKRATNGLAMRRGEGFGGLCHLGLFDLVEPLIYREATLGIFYYGQVSIEEWRTKSHARIRRYCLRRKLEVAPFLETFRSVPSIPLAEVEAYQARLRTIVETVGLLCEALAVPVDRYRINWESVTWRFLSKQPSLVRMVGNHVSQHYGDDCRVSDLARRFQCHPNYLGALFRKSTGQSLNDFVSMIRVERAKHLLRVGRFSVSEVGYKCGFADPSHFGRIFRKKEGVSPLAYRESFVKARS